MGLRNDEYRDTDLLAKLVAEGPMSSLELAESLAMDDIPGHRSVGSRFARMRSFGMVSFDEKTRIWMITDNAERVLEAQRKSATQRKIAAIPDDALVEVVSDAMTRRRLGDPVLAEMLRRETQFGMAHMKRWRSNGR